MKLAKTPIRNINYESQSDRNPMNAKFALILLMAITFSACKSAEVIRYNSNAGVPHYSVNNHTVIDVVLNDGDNRRSYGVLVALSNKENEYIVLAPKQGISLTINNSISNFNLELSTYLDKEAAEKFINTLTMIESEWDQEKEDYTGSFHQFGTALITDVRSVGTATEEIVEFIPTVRFYFNVTSDGPIGELIIAKKFPAADLMEVRAIEFSSKSEIEDLRELLTLAVEEVH